MCVIFWHSGSNSISWARTASFSLPPAVSALVSQGVELGHADDQVFGRIDSKRSNGAVGLLTKDLITRSMYYEHALILALVPFLNSETYGLSFHSQTTSDAAAAQE
eukprot:c12115_g1_i1.p1 GENE.c12115_g1_i1~~c12115_g1_i1.p1  ORF type:complete len:106 (+),score=15.10 c12115_g1_i1:422-739(+)